MTSMLLGAAPTAAAADDGVSGDAAAPQLVEFQVNPLSVDVTTSPATITMRAHLRDDRSGVEAPVVLAYAPGGAYQGAPLALTSGDILDGWWTGTTDIDVGASPGTYRLDLSTHDRVGNDLSVGAAALEAAGFPGHVEVRDVGGDRDGPTIRAVRVIDTEVDVRNGAATCRIEVDADDPSGVMVVGVRARSPLGGSSAFLMTSEFELVAGDVGHGTRRGSLAVPEHVHAGRWQLDYAVALDARRNSGFAYPTDGGALVLGAGFDVRSVEDVVPPSITQPEVDPLAADVNAGDQVVHARMRVVDSLAGVSAQSQLSSVGVELADPRGLPSTYISMSRIAGDEHDGIWDGRGTIPRYAATGRRRIRLIASDVVGNSTTIDASDSGGPSAVVVYSVPLPPTDVRARPTLGGATIRWQPPVDDGASAITSYVLDEQPGGAELAVDAATRQATSTSLQPGSTHSFTVRALNAAGSSTSSAPVTTAALDHQPAGGFHVLTPTRIVDTRSPGDPLRADQERAIAISGRGGVPRTGAETVLLNVTAVDATEDTFITVWPGGPRPPTSSLNPTPGEVTANLVAVPVGDDGSIHLYDLAGSVHVIVDVVGWFDDGTNVGDAFTVTRPTRALDTRAATPLRAGQTRTVRAVGVADVPPSAAAVMINLTATDSTEPTFLTAWGDGPRPLASTLNPTPGQTTANLTTVPVGPDGNFRLFSMAGTTTAVVDIVGWFGPDGTTQLTGLAPVRVVDTRVGIGLPTALGGGTVARIKVAASSDAGEAQRSVLVNITAADATDDTYLTLWDGPEPRPTASSLNPSPKRITANLATVPIARDGTIAVYAHAGVTDIVVDLLGHFG